MIATPKTGDAAEAAELYFDSIAKIWNQDRRESFADRMEQSYWMSENESKNQPYNLRDNSYWREPIEMANKREVERITLLKSTQVGGTVTSYGILIAAALIDPAPSMIVFPTEPEAKLQRDRIYENMLASEPEIRHLVPPRKSWNMTAIDMQTQLVYIAYSKGKQTMRGKPCRRVLMTETDVYGDDDAYGTPEDRTKRFPDKLILEESTPKGNQSYIFKQFEKSQKRFRWFQCPTCKKWQKVSFFTKKDGPNKGCGGVGGYRDAAGNLLSVEAARRQVHYVCIDGCKIAANYKNFMLQRGQWVAAGCSINQDTGEIEGEPYVKSVAHLGYHIWTILQDEIDLATIVENYITLSNEGRIRKFYEDWLGWRFVSARSIPTYLELFERFATPNYQLGQVPDAVWFLTLGADVQNSEVYWTVYGWAPFRTPYLIDLGVFNQDTYENAFTKIRGEHIPTELAQLIPLMNSKTKTWPVAGSGKNPLGLANLAIKFGGVDTNYRMDEVHKLTKLFKQPDPKADRLRNVRGDHYTAEKDIRYRLTDQVQNKRKTKTYVGGLRLWQCSKPFYLDLLNTRLSMKANEPQALRLPQNLLDSPFGEIYLRQMVNERPTEVRNKKTNYAKDQYGIVNHALRVDFRDTTRIAEIVADMVTESTFGELDWSAKSWERWQQKQAQATAAAMESSQRQIVLPNDIIAR